MKNKTDMQTMYDIYSKMAHKWPVRSGYSPCLKRLQLHSLQLESVDASDFNSDRLAASNAILMVV